MDWHDLRSTTLKPELAAFLARHAPHTEESAVWRDGLIHLRVTGYLCDETPPLDYVTSVRGLVFRDDLILAFRDRHGVHILPGGRREPSEVLEETLRREVLEETSWTIADASLLGFAHFHHLTPKPPDYVYPYPDFLQVVYVAEAIEFVPESKLADDDVDESFFYPLSDVHALDLTPGERHFLHAAERLRARPRRSRTE